MSVFNQKENQKSTAKNGTATNGVVNIIGAGTRIEGDIRCDGDIRVDGTVKGTVTSKSKIVVGSTGTVEGDLFCENADLSGKVYGSVEVEELLFMKSSSVLEGDMITGKLVVETGARFNGNCSMGIKELKHSEKPVTQQQLAKEAV